MRLRNSGSSMRYAWILCQQLNGKCTYCIGIIFILKHLLKYFCKYFCRVATIKGLTR